MHGSTIDMTQARSSIVHSYQLNGREGTLTQKHVYSSSREGLKKLENVEDIEENKKHRNEKDGRIVKGQSNFNK